MTMAVVFEHADLQVSGLEADWLQGRRTPRLDPSWGSRAVDLLVGEFSGAAAQYVLRKGGRGPGLRPSSGKRRLRCHAPGHHPAAMGGALAVPSRETPALQSRLLVRASSTSLLPSPSPNPPDWDARLAGSGAYGLPSPLVFLLPTPPRETSALLDVPSAPVRVTCGGDFHLLLRPGRWARAGTGEATEQEMEQGLEIPEQEG
ncbi:hypothetical protein J1605_022425 [Eschrichtius robustus]|uniref:Uncharacterized protein n=1 Tax=Eschrichtius robustus TaxID=9764 RepID=A0AB34HCK1_ESCRO|nr:hypothetical protein J1605_022425 [Eschrichtius robustus]